MKDVYLQIRHSIPYSVESIEAFYLHLYYRLWCVSTYLLNDIQYSNSIRLKMMRVLKISNYNRKINKYLLTKIPGKIIQFI